MGKYLFLYLKTGGGHLAPAKAVAEKIKIKHKGKIDILLIDGLYESQTFVKKIIEDGYKNAINHAAWTFGILYEFHKIPVFAKLTTSIISFFIKPGIERQIRNNKLEKIVIFHFFLIKPVFEILKKFKLDIPVITVVTDPFTAHPMWFLRKDQNYVVFSEVLKLKCVEMGIDSKNLHLFPFVLQSKFSDKTSIKKKLQTRMDLGFKPDSKIVLIMGGGEGMPGGKKILTNIISRNMDAEIAIICGNDQKLFSQANKLKEKQGLMNLKVFGFIDYVHSLISISEVVITKCGASTFMEILMMGKVPVINKYIWEQEKGNVDFVCKSNMGILEKNKRIIPTVLNHLLSDSEFYQSLCNNIKNASFRNGVGQVSDYIINFK